MPSRGTSRQRVQSAVGQILVPSATLTLVGNLPGRTTHGFRLLLERKRGPYVRTYDESFGEARVLEYEESALCHVMPRYGPSRGSNNQFTQGGQISTTGLTSHCNGLIIGSLGGQIAEAWMDCGRRRTLKSIAVLVDGQESSQPLLLCGR
jgi:hypothetical protein